MNARHVAGTLLVLVMVALPVGAGQWWVPAAAHVAGAAGSVWRTDLLLHNFGSADASLTVTLLRQGADNSGLATTATLSVPADATVVVEDALLALFEHTGNAALKLDAATDQLVVTSRTFNQSSHGTFGQAIPGATDGSTLAAGQTALLLGLSGTDGRRTNLGWVSLEDAAVTVTVELLGADGQALASASFAERPYGQTQLNDLFGRLGSAPTASAYARVSASGRIQPYASVVAAGSNDPVYVAAQGNLDLATSALFPAVAHVAGAGDTSWRTDAWFLNPTSQRAAVDLELLLQNQANPNPPLVRVTLAPGEQREVADLVLAAFGLASAQGAVLVHADQPILATSRTYNTAADGTYGQSIPARTITALPGPGETVYLPGAAQDGAYRSNLGLVASSAGSRVDLLLRAADGSVLATASQELGQNEQVQVNLETLFATTGFAGATVEATLAAAAEPDATLGAYLSVVDRTSSDPTYLEAARGLAADPGLDHLDETVVATTYALAKAVDSSGPQIRGARAAVDKDGECVTVDYSGDTLLPGQSPEGKCWLAAITFAGCTYSFPMTTWSLSQDGTATADVCIVDAYPSTLTADLRTTLDDSATGQHLAYGLDAQLRLVLGFGQGSRPSSALLQGTVAVDANGVGVDGWVDLLWAANATGFELIPSGVMGLHFPYPTEHGSTTAEVTATFDGSEWVYVQVRLGYYHAAFCLNLVTGEVRAC
jgi:hypothetical protein